MNRRHQSRIAPTAMRRVDGHVVGTHTVGTTELVLATLVLGLVGLAAGCTNGPLAASRSAPESPAPLRLPPPDAEECASYEDALTGGQVFSMYCSYCHNAPALAERPFAQYRNVAAHMRVRANLTGKEYEKLMVFLRRWHDVPPPNRPVELSPKRFFFEQPLQELRDQSAGTSNAGNQPSAGGAAPGQPGAVPAAPGK